MEQIASSVAALLQQCPDAAVIWPLHLNPLVQQSVRAIHAVPPEMLPEVLTTLPVVASQTP